MGMEQSVRASLEALEPDTRDQAARDLAVMYAGELDVNPEAIGELGPKLLAVLEALGMTPRARAAATKVPPGGVVRNPLDEMKARRAARAAG